MPIDRSRYVVRKTTLAGEGRADTRSSPGQLVAMIEELTAQAWAFKDGHWDEPRLRRDVVRVVRRGR